MNVCHHPSRYNDFDKISYINQNYILETFCVGSVGQYIWNYASKLKIWNLFLNMFINFASKKEFEKLASRKCHDLKLLTGM